MMYGTPFASGLLWLHVHWVFGGILIFGIIAGLIWVNKFASKDQAYKWAVWSFVVGALGLVLTATMAFSGFQTIMSSWMMGGGMQNMNMMEKMMNDK